MRGTQLSTFINRDILVIRADFVNTSSSLYSIRSVISVCRTESMETLTNMVLGFQMDHYELDRVQERLMFEWEQGRQSVDSLLDDAIHKAAYKSHPYGNSLISNPEHVKLSSEGLQLYMQDALKRSNNGILGIEVDHEHLMAIQGAALGERTFEHPRALVNESKAYRGLGEERIEVPASSTDFLIAFEAPSLASPDCAVSLLLRGLLSGHHVSHLHPRKSSPLHACSKSSGCLGAVPYTAMHAQSALFGIRFTFSNQSAMNDIRHCIDDTFTAIRQSCEESQG